jgi:hypothetical protein
MRRMCRSLRPTATELQSKQAAPVLVGEQPPKLLHTYTGQTVSISRNGCGKPLRSKAATFALLLLFCGVCSCRKTAPQVTNVSLPNDASRALEECSQLTLFSLDPAAAESESLVPRLEGFRILGKTVLADQKRTQVVQAVHGDIARWNGDMALCFYPRHGIEVSKEGVHYHFLICYECGVLEVFGPAGPPTVIGISGSGDAFNKILNAVGIPLAPPRQEEAKR